MDSLAYGQFGHIHSALCNYGLGGQFGTPRTNESAASSAKTYASASNVQFGANESAGHSTIDELHIANSHYSMNSAPKVAFGASGGGGWVPFGSAGAKTAGRLNVVA